MGVKSTKLRKSARGQRCTIEIPGVCNHNPETVVLAHAPSEVKGIGNKAHDYHAAFACHDCHMALDQRHVAKWEAYFYWLRGIQRTQEIWRQMGLLIVPADKPRPKTSSKIMQRRFRGSLT